MQYPAYLIIFMASFFLFSNVVYAAAHEIDSYQYYVHTLSPQSLFRDNLAGVLGQGWSSDHAMPVGECLSGSVEHAGIPAGSVSMDTCYRYEDVMNQLNLKVDGNLSVAGFSLEASNNYFHLLQDTSYSQTFIYRAVVYLKNRHFTPSSYKSPLTWIGNQYANDPIAFRAFCGDKFIAEQQIGGALYVAVKFLFHTKQEKSDFDFSSKTSFFSLAYLAVNLNKITTSMKSNGSISVTAFQIGGDPTRLGQILGATPGSTTVSPLACALNNLAACKQAINQMLVYAGTSVDGNFPTQFTDDDTTTPIGPGVIANILQQYGAVVPLKIGPTVVTTDIVASRAWLSTAFEASTMQSAEVNNIINEHIPMSPDYVKKLAILKANVDSNNKLLSDAGIACYADDLSYCVATEKVAQDKLLPVDLTAFRKRFNAKGDKQYYLFPYAAQQYIFTRGNQAYHCKILTLKMLTPNNLAFASPHYWIHATSQDHGVTYQGEYSYTRFPGIEHHENLTLFPDFTMP